MPKIKKVTQQVGSNKTTTGVVISDKMRGSAVVEVIIWKVDRIIKKRYPRNRTFIVDNPGNTFKTGDTVKIVEIKPMSRHKHFRIIELVGKK